MAEELTIRSAQYNQPWSLAYAERDSDAHARYASTFACKHAVLHAMKSLGKIAAELEANDHDNAHSTLTDYQIATVANMSADLVSSVLRIAGVLGFDLESVLRRRVIEKNGKGYPE
jgi:hypothetical protein